MVHSAAAGARGIEGRGIESVHPQVPKKPQAGGKEGPYQDRPLLCPFRLSPLLTCS